MLAVLCAGSVPKYITPDPAKEHRRARIRQKSRHLPDTGGGYGIRCFYGKAGEWPS